MQTKIISRSTTPDAFKLTDYVKDYSFTRVIAAKWKKIISQAVRFNGEPNSSTVMYCRTEILFTNSVSNIPVQETI